MRGGVLGGLLGPVFLLAPLGLLALRFPAGRQLLLAALLFGLPYIGNIGTRFLLPALPFVALSMGLAVAGSSVAAVALTVAHAIFSWPPVMPRYCSPDAWRLTAEDSVRAGAAHRKRRVVPELPHADYGTARMLDRLMPPGAKVFTFSGAPEAYTPREILVAYPIGLRQRQIRRYSLDVR